MTRVTVLIPTFDHAATLPLTIESVLDQTLQDFEILIVGDGVTTEVRQVSRALEASDPRIHFLDFPKGPNHGEIHRHTAILRSVGEVIAYMCDDDLMLPNHLEDLSGLLETRDLVQSLNGRIDPDGAVHLYPGDLSDSAFVHRLCDIDRGFSFVSITGTAHTRALYDRAQTPWQTTPEGQWPDQYQWRRMLMSGVVNGATSTRMTAISFPTHLSGRGQWSGEERAAEIQRWAQIVRSATGQQHIDRLTADAAWRQLVLVTLHEMQAHEMLKLANDELAQLKLQLGTPN
ncbi:MAG: hypothetical protein JWO10_1001 [Microbacteriaceae bacterium]|nr:hypothetical protein [Microbacteriaceae bacterium]